MPNKESTPNTGARVNGSAMPNAAKAHDTKASGAKINDVTANGFVANGAELPAASAHTAPDGAQNTSHVEAHIEAQPDAPRVYFGDENRRYAQIIGWGVQVPEKVITNRDLEQIVDTTDEWIRERTGIEERHVAADPKETSATLGAAAARKALEMADIPPSKVGLVICATSSPEHIFPSTASIIQDLIGAANAGAFDLSAACSGFVYALSMARGSILAGDSEYVLVIGAETLSRFVDWTDRGTCILFGDGAGALLVAASNVPGGILAVELGSDGSGAETLTLKAGGSALPATLETVNNGDHYIRMDGKAVFRFATRVMAEATQKVLARAGMTTDDVDLVVPHQANIRIIQNSVYKQLRIPEEKVYINLQKYGNTSTASIPIALVEAIEDGKVKPGDKLVFVGFGAGLTWAACAVEWSVPTEKRDVNWWQNTRRQATYQAAAARSMWKKAVRWVYDVLPNDPEAVPAETTQRSKE